MGKKGDTENLKSSFRTNPKNLRKFVVIYHEKMYLYGYFHIFRSSRMLKRKNFLIIDFSQCYLNGKLRPFGGVKTGQIEFIVFIYTRGQAPLHGSLANPTFYWLILNKNSFEIFVNTEKLITIFTQYFYFNF